MGSNSSTRVGDDGLVGLKSRRWDDAKKIHRPFPLYLDGAFFAGTALDCNVTFTELVCTTFSDASRGGLSSPVSGDDDVGEIPFPFAIVTLLDWASLTFDSCGRRTSGVDGMVTGTEPN